MRARDPLPPLQLDQRRPGLLDRTIGELGVKPIFVAKRRFGPAAGEKRARYIAWSGLGQLRELVSLDGILCLTVPEALTPPD